jgi:hypothetical protein
MFNKTHKSYKLNSDCINVCVDPFPQRAVHKYRINVYYILTILETLIRNVDLGDFRISMPSLVLSVT